MNPQKELLWSLWVHAYLPKQLRPLTRLLVKIETRNLELLVGLQSSKSPKP